MSDGPRFYGADLRCPTCGAPAIDVVAGYDLFEGVFLFAKSDDTVIWTCNKNHTNQTTVTIGEVTTRTL